MPKKDYFDKKELEGESMVIDSEDHYDELISKGFEVLSITYSAERESEESKEMHMHVKMQLKKEEKLYVANADKIGGVTLGLQSLYNFDLKKPVFTKTKGGALSSDLEMALVDMVIGKYTKPLRTNKIESRNPKKIFELMKDWIDKEKHARFGMKNAKEIFYLTCVIFEKDGKITKKNIHKELVTLQEINKIKEGAKNYDNCLVLSFFYLLSKSKKDKKTEDVLVGSILYDLKNKKTVCFNIISSISFESSKVKEQKPNTHNIVEYLFESSINEKMECKSFIPLPIDSPWYTPLPWICYSSIVSNELKYTESIDQPHAISIGEFFVFGKTPYPDEANSFQFKQFSSSEKGSATTILQLSDNEKELAYNFRFDSSKGEPLVHMDFAYYDGKEHKLIEHFPIDLENVFSFSKELYVAVIMAGFFDSYFTTIIKSGLKNLNAMIDKQPILRYPFKWIWMLDTAIIWINENPGGYEILEKLMKGATKLNDSEKQYVEKMNEENLDLIVEDEKCEQFGVSYLGYTVFQRYKRGYTKVLMNP